ncbi:ABC transporter permease [Candidatus Haliotispira prima]|uniref:ABC transporter permease n=1 Tax=Candidatus Haliotispira prima TaxID=3034016 RepID=A0ABY8MFA7_9SPIO|nr:ABC transporter permease [Candidatus Haliotispira prima]
MKPITNLLKLGSFSGSQWVGLGLLTLLLSLVAINALFYAHDPALQNLENTFASASIAEPLGTDHFGRSNLARLSSAILKSLLMALFTVATSALLGVSAGVLAGWKAGWWDRCCSFAANIILALPGLILVLLFGALRPGSFIILYFAISLIQWVEYFRVIRSRTRALIPSTEASRLYGFGDWYIFRRHLWPELRSDIFTLACFGAGNAILALASIGFLYVGLKPPEAELGLLMVEHLKYISQAPWLLLLPIGAVLLLVGSFHLLVRSA